ncbi:molecular chaperone [Kineothrix sp. MB12-C1]|uniref:molecular chaperone n=1 Tax=Kineothrix sp. MB12-C1 TaxID=3070215 RepID=UPI0027D2CC35|nr:molecular chaperone [Kineothrix sp. MB12-C1]WMC93859.1 molecular chaperone [Kineothrix sp. MB12-C1]
MEQLRAEQKEALQVSKEYLVKLTIGMEELVLELRGNRKPDTDDFMKQCLDGLNWLIQIYNGTADFINEGKVRIEKEEANESILRFNEAVKSKDDNRIAESMEKDIIMFLHNLSNAIDEAI